MSYCIMDVREGGLLGVAGGRDAVRLALTRAAVLILRVWWAGIWRLVAWGVWRGFWI